MADPDKPTPGTLPTRAERPRRAPPPRSSGAAVLPEGHILGDYRIVRALGSGGMGTVYEAIRLGMGKAVAIKLLAAEAAADPQARARFVREAEAASKIQHPHVVNVIDYGTAEATPFIVMQLLRGEDLGRRLDRHPRGLPITEVADTLLAVCAGVLAAHEAGVIHRDLKPTNIFLARVSPQEIVPKVLDFGISKLKGHASAPLTDPGAVLGTTPYLSPEQISGAEVDGRTDQHALGVVIYECLTGRRPFEGDTPQAVMRNIRDGRFVPPAMLRPDLPAELEGLIRRALAHDPADRFTTVHDVGAALWPFASPKKQLLWADFYGPRVADGVPLPAAGPPTASSPPTVLLPREPADTRTQEKVADGGRGKATSRLRQPGRSWTAPVILGVLLVITAARLITRLGVVRPEAPGTRPPVGEMCRVPVTDDALVASAVLVEQPLICRAPGQATVPMTPVTQPARPRRAKADRRSPNEVATRPPRLAPAPPSDPPSVEPSAGVSAGPILDP